MSAKDKSSQKGEKSDNGRGKPKRKATEAQMADAEADEAEQIVSKRPKIEARAPAEDSERAHAGQAQNDDKKLSESELVAEKDEKTLVKAKQSLETAEQQFPIGKKAEQQFPIGKKAEQQFPIGKKAEPPSRIGKNAEQQSLIGKKAEKEEKAPLCTDEDGDVVILDAPPPTKVTKTVESANQTQATSANQTQATSANQTQATSANQTQATAANQTQGTSAKETEANAETKAKAKSKEKAKVAVKADNRLEEAESAIQAAGDRIRSAFGIAEATLAEAVTRWKAVPPPSTGDAKGTHFLDFRTISFGSNPDGGRMGELPVIGLDPAKPHLFPARVYGLVPGVTTWAELLMSWPHFAHLRRPKQFDDGHQGDLLEVIEPIGLVLSLFEGENKQMEGKRLDELKCLQPSEKDRALRNLSLPILPAGVAPGSFVRAYLVLMGNECDQLSLPLQFLASGRSWPPCSNFSGQEPITFLQVGPGDATRKEHHCLLCVRGTDRSYIPKHDNRSQNMVVIHTGGSGPGLGYNKYAYLEALASCDRRDPMTRKHVPMDTCARILEASHFDIIHV